ncbi:MAG: hypothetical protein IPJ23_07690 [Ignavibacteriales bacterium]|nr:hypothetical protein [Ignavibacteriales bacterium]
MQLPEKTLYTTLIILNIFLALTAIPGGFCLLTGIAAPPIEELNDSVFKDYIIPGLALMIIVGGSALFTSIMLIRKNKYALLFSALCGLIIMFFEFVEVLAIGSPTGAGLVMQIIYFILGVLLVKLSLFIIYFDKKTEQNIL